MAVNQMRSFLKWAGGKYKIINRIQQALPNGRQLIEHFAGSGIVFFNVDFEEYLVADTIADLIHLYKQVQVQGNNFALYASALFTPENNTEVAFYDLRAKFNACTDLARKSALFVYLNRHCFNGLCRYCSKGQFNVPFVRYTKPTFSSVEMLNFHDKSKRAVFEVADIKVIMEKAEIGSVVYCDLPYALLTTMANFCSYTKDGFTLNDKQALADCAKKLIGRDIPVVISNHKTESTQSLYSKAKIISFEVFIQRISIFQPNFLYTREFVCN